MRGETFSEQNYYANQAIGSAPDADNKEPSMQAAAVEKHTEQRDVSRQQVCDELVTFGITPDAEAPLEALQNRLSVLRYLEKKEGSIQRHHGALIVDTDKIKRMESRGRTAGGIRITIHNVLEALRNTQGYHLKDVESVEFQEGKLEAGPVVAFPKHIEDISHTWPQDAQKALLRPWELGGKRDWTEPVLLDSGDETNMAELAIAAKAFGDLKARRTKTGTLEIYDSRESAYKPFSAELYEQLAPDVLPRTSRYSHSGKRSLLGFHTNALIFLQQCAPRLLELGLFRPEDFSRLGGGSAAEVFGVHERRLNPKAPYATFTNKTGQSAAYYLGKERLVGSDISIDPETMHAELLDPELAGIIEERHGRKVVLRIFPLLSEPEAQALQAIAAEGLAARGKEATGENISMNARVGGSEMRARMKEYRVRDFVSPRADETPEQYGERITRLGDVNFVTENVRNIFTKAGIGTHHLPWAEQLILAGAIMEESNSHRLQEFAERFGLEGVRVLTSADYGPESVKNILAFAEQEPAYARELFSEYNAFRDSSESMSGMVSLESAESIPEHVRSRFPKEFHEALTRRAKDLLVAFSDARQEQYPLERHEHIGALRGINLFMEIMGDFASAEQNGNFRFAFLEQDANGSTRFSVEDLQSGFTYTLKLFVRSEPGAHGEQARINMEVGFDTENPQTEFQELFRQTTTFKARPGQKEKIRQESVLRIGVDLENNADMSLISLDLGRNPRDDAQLKRDGDVLAKTLQRSSREGAHTQDSFSKIYAPHFPFIAESFRRMVDRKISALRVTRQEAIAA